MLRVAFGAVLLLSAVLASRPAAAVGPYRVMLPVVARNYAEAVVAPTPSPVAGQPAPPTATSTPPPTATPQPSGGGGGLTLDDINGRSFLLAEDGTYLGVVSSSQFAADSICNKFGTYGSQFSATSVRNKFGTYGSEFSSQSAYNQFTSTPPAIVYSGRIIGFLTKNTFIGDGVDPDSLFAYYRST